MVNTELFIPYKQKKQQFACVTTWTVREPVATQGLCQKRRAVKFTDKLSAHIHHLERHPRR